MELEKDVSFKKIELLIQVNSYVFQVSIGILQIEIQTDLFTFKFSLKTISTYLHVITY